MQITRQRLIHGLFRELAFNNRLAYMFVILLVLGLGASEYQELFTVEDIYGGYANFVHQTIEPRCAWDSLPYGRGGLNWYLVCASYLGFDNSRVIPFLVSLALIPVTFFTIRIYSNNFIAVLTAVGLALNPVYLIFDSSSAYAQTWAILFLGSLYLLKRNPLGGIAAFNLSLFCKAIPMAWGPFIIWFLIKSKSDTLSKWIIGLGIGVPLVLLFSLSLFDSGSQVYGFLKLKPLTENSFLEMMQWIKISYRWNEELLVAYPITFILYWLKRKSWNLSPFPFQMLAVANISFFAIALFTVEGYFPYRLIPNITMFLFAASTLLYGYLAKNVFKQSDSLKT